MIYELNSKSYKFIYKEMFLILLTTRWPQVQAKRRVVTKYIYRNYTHCTEAASQLMRRHSSYSSPVFVLFLEFPPDSFVFCYCQAFIFLCSLRLYLYPHHVTSPASFLATPTLALRLDFLILLSATVR